MQARTWLNIPQGPGGPITEDHHCFACDKVDDKFMIWCAFCNKHLHPFHFVGDPEEAFQTWVQKGWPCDDCDDMSSDDDSGGD